MSRDRIEATERDRANRRAQKWLQDQAAGVLTREQVQAKLAALSERSRELTRSALNARIARDRAA